MKRQSGQHQQGSILLLVMMTITILTLICATSLYVTKYSANATTQTTSWQQAMAGAEAAVDAAMNALNTNTWTGWYTVTGTSVPSTQPSPAGTPFPVGSGALPAAGQYNYYSTSFALQGEASNSVTMWVTVDNGSLTPVSSGLTNALNNNAQAYRIRATAMVAAPGPKRVSNNKLDNDLRHISLMFDRLTGTTNASSNGQASRRVELVAVPVAQSLLGRALTLKNGIQMSGGAYIDSFDSSNPFKSTNSLYDSTKKQMNGDVGIANTKNGNTYSDLKSSIVDGSIQYSGPAIKNTGGVTGGISTPFNATIPATADPAANTSSPPAYAWTDPDKVSGDSYTAYQWTPAASASALTAGTYTSFSASGSLPTNAGSTVTSVTATGSSTSPALIVVNGDFTVPGGKSFTINASTYPTGNPKAGQTDASNSYVVIWVKGKFTTSGSGYIQQANGAHVTWVIDGDITTSGGSFQNMSGMASSSAIIGVGTGHTLTVSGSGNFIGVLNAPGYDITISGGGSFSGAAIGNSVNISGSGGFHYDQALAGSSGPVANYAYASWFEDNSDPSRGVVY
jgi:hypothetical protein